MILKRETFQGVIYAVYHLRKIKLKNRERTTKLTRLILLMNIRSDRNDSSVCESCTPSKDHGRTSTFTRGEGRVSGDVPLTKHQRQPLLRTGTSHPPRSTTRSCAPFEPERISDTRIYRFTQGIGLLPVRRHHRPFPLPPASRSKLVAHKRAKCHPWCGRPINMDVYPTLNCVLI